MKANTMNSIFLVVSVLALALSASIAEAKNKQKTQPPRGMIESMQSLPCGVKQKGLNGLGAVWGSIGVTSVSSNEKLCPQYLFRTDQLEYHIRPADSKHPVLLPIGHEAEFRLKKDKIFLKVPDGDKQTRAYKVISMEPTKSESAEGSTAYRLPAGSPAPPDAGVVVNKPAERGTNIPSNQIPPQTPPSPTEISPPPQQRFPQMRDEQFIGAESLSAFCTSRTVS